MDIKELLAPPQQFSKLELFSKYKARTTRNACISVEGREKRGKTHFALTAPGPIVYFNLDEGLDRVQPEIKFPNLDLRVVNIPNFSRDGHPDHVAEQALRVWEQLKEQHINALESARTVVYDSFTEIWEVARLARFGKLTQVQWFHYGPINREFHDFIREFNKHDANLILLHKVMAEKDSNGAATGGFERKSFNHIGFDVDDFFRVDRDDTGAFFVECLESGHNAEIKGKRFAAPCNTFTDIALSLFPSSVPTDWM